MSAMKQDLAEKFAALTIEGCPVEQAQKVIREFLTQIVRCPVCDGEGTITVGRMMTASFPAGHPGDNDLKDRAIPAGTKLTCPRCGGGLDGQGAYDPEFVAWHCIRGESDGTCRSDRTGEKASRATGHAECGYRIVLPL